MALQLAFSTPFGIDLPAAYAKIESYSGTRDSMVISVHYYATAAARDAGTPIIAGQTYQWNNSDMSMTSVTDADGLVAALYVYLKTLPEFAEAEDA